MASILFEYLSSIKRKKLLNQKIIFENLLEKLPNFYFEMKWDFESNLIPLFSKISPSDTIKIWKFNDHLRMDNSIVGFKNLKIKRRNISLLFNPYNFKECDEFKKYNSSKKSLKILLLLNKSNKFFTNPYVILFF